MRPYHVVAAIVASLTATIGMAAEPEQRFVHQGHTYVYQTADSDAGRVITGHQLDNGAPFRLVVKNGRVTGMSGGTPVSFRVREAEGATGGIVGSSN
jgi:hypothetical protein